MRPELSSRDGHYEAATLHAYLRNELSPEASREISAHLASCSQCRDLCDFVESGSKLLATDPVPDFSPMVWRRIEVQLDRQRKSQIDRHLGTHVTAWARYRRPGAWGVFAGACALALALILPQWSSDQKPHSADTQPLASGLPAAHSTMEGTRVSLESGREFRVRGNALEKVLETNQKMPVFSLAAGELEVTELRTNLGTNKPLALQAPGFRAIATSADFALSLWSHSIELAVSEGEVEVERPETAAQIIKSGNSARISLPSPKPAAPKNQRSKGFDSSSGNSKSLSVPSASAPETEVDVIAPERSPAQILWDKAATAYFEQGKRELAIELAKQLVDDENPRTIEYKRALGLLCEASIALRRGLSAAKYCEQSLADETVIENRRSLHRRLGSVYREMVGDCQKAIEHFSKALAFGGTSVLDERTILGRAYCAYELGDLGLAQSDVNLLTSRGAKLIRKTEVNDLLHLLKTGQNKKAKN